MGGAQADDGVARLRQLLRWKCRRGMRELDHLLLCWLSRFPDAGAAELHTFSQLLDAEDDALWAWLSGRASSGRPAWDVLIEQIRAAAGP